MTDVVQIKKGAAVLQTCTQSVKVIPDPCNETSVTSYSDAHEVVTIKVEEDTDVRTKVEIPEPISFSAIKAEPQEVSYMSLCPLLDTCHKYPEMHSVFHHVHPSMCPLEQLCCGQYKLLSPLDLHGSLVMISVCK
jgi:hypothetical protein